MKISFAALGLLGLFAGARADGAGRKLLTEAPEPTTGGRRAFPSESGAAVSIKPITDPVLGYGLSAPEDGYVNGVTNSDWFQYTYDTPSSLYHFRFPRLTCKQAAGQQRFAAGANPGSVFSTMPFVTQVRGFWLPTSADTDVNGCDYVVQVWFNRYNEELYRRFHTYFTQASTTLYGGDEGYKKVFGEWAGYVVYPDTLPGAADDNSQDWTGITLIETKTWNFGNVADFTYISQGLVDSEDVRRARLIVAITVSGFVGAVAIASLFYFLAAKAKAGAVGAPKDA